VLTAGFDKDTLSLNGTAKQALRVFGNPSQVAADQNTPATFSFGMETSFADAYDLRAEAPVGWTVEIDDSRIVTALPAPGLQDGTFPIRLVARSRSPAAPATGPAISSSSRR
jgi:hypothetical protein